MEISVEILESKQYNKAEKMMGKEAAQEFCKKTDQELKDLLAYNAIHEQEIKNSIEANVEYQKAKETLKLFSDSLKERTSSTKMTSNLAKLLMTERRKNNRE